MSPNRNYRRGADFERAVKKDLETSAPPFFVVRSAGSHSPADLMASRHIRYYFYDKRGQLVKIRLDGADVYLVQCKTDSVVSAKEMENLEIAADMAYADPIIAYRPKGGGIAYKYLNGEPWTP